MKTFKEYLTEAKVIVNVMNKTGNNNLSFNNVKDAEKYIDSLKLDLKKDYFDIHTGSNTSEIQGLHSWGGVKGYWYNCLNDKDMKQSEKDKIKKLQLTEEKLNEKNNYTILNDYDSKNKKYWYIVDKKGDPIYDDDGNNIHFNSFNKAKEYVNEYLTEASEVDYDILVKDIDEKAQMLKNEVDRITKRFHYRFITNISYNKKEATKITDEVWKEFEKAENIVSKCWNKIG